MNQPSLYTYLFTLVVLFHCPRLSIAQEYQSLYDSAVAYYSADPNLSISYGTQALAKANDLEQKANANFMIAASLFNTGKDSEALMYYFNALRQYRELNNEKRISDVMLNIAVIFKNAFAYDKALHIYQQVASMKQGIEDRFWLAETYRNIGKVYRLKGDYDSASHFNAEALKIYIDLDDVKSQAIIYNEIGILHREANQLDAAIEYYLKSLSTVEGTKAEVYRKAKAYNNIGDAYLAKEYYEEARHYLSQSLEIKNSLNQINSITTLNNLAQTYDALNIPDSAVYYLKMAMNTTDSLSIDALKSREMLAEIYLKSGDVDNAIQSYKDIDKYARNVAQIRQNSDKLYNFYQVESVLNEINQLEREKVTQRERWISIIIIALSLIAIAVILMIVWKSAKRRKDNKKAILAEFRNL